MLLSSCADILASVFNIESRNISSSSTVSGMESGSSPTRTSPVNSFSFCSSGLSLTWFFNTFFCWFFSEEDKGRRNTIVSLLTEWGLVKPLNTDQIVEPVAPLSQIKILPHKEKNDWELVAKYSIGKKR